MESNILRRQFIQNSQVPSNSSEITTTGTSLEYSYDDSYFPLESNDWIQQLLDSHYSSNPENEEDLLFAKLLEYAFTGNESQHFKSHFTPGLTSFPSLVNKRDGKQGASALHYACMRGHLSAAKFLIDNGATPDIWDSGKSVTPLICASAHGHLDIVKYLVKTYPVEVDINAGLDINTSFSSLIWAVRLGYADIVRFLLKNSASQVSAVIYSETPTHAAVIAGSPEILKLLIESGGKGDLCMGASDKDTPLHYAASGEHPNALECCKILLEKAKVDVNAVNQSGQTPLHIAAWKSYDPDIIQMLISHGAVVDVVDNEEKTPLFYLLSDDQLQLSGMEKLLQNRCNVNHKDKAGNTPLHVAAFVEAVAATELLLMNGADYSIRNDANITALHLLLRKIPNTNEILKRVFDQAVVVSRYKNEPSQNWKAKVNYRFVVSSSVESPSSSTPDLKSHRKSTDGGDGGALGKGKKRYGTYATSTDPLDPEKQPKGFSRPETSKIKCLIDENQSSLLLHPLIHSFLSMKWGRARPIFGSIFLFKAILVALFSIFVRLPFLIGTDELKNVILSKTVMDGDTNKQEYTNVTETEFEELSVNQPNISYVKIPYDDLPAPPVWFTVMYGVIVGLAILNALIELAQLIRAPRSQWLSLEPFLFIIVVGIILAYLDPRGHWNRTNTIRHRTMAAVAICLSWLDLWSYMGRFPNFGLSIRVFFTVFKNFCKFLLPHVCLFAGFGIAFTLLFPKNGEFVHIFLTIPKMARIMAGDITIAPEGSNLDTTFPNPKFPDKIAGLLMVYTYTAYVVTVSIVLMNLLIGLAVNNIQEIYAEASKNRLIKQTLLLHTLETNFISKWGGPLGKLMGLMSKHITLFPSEQARVLIFKPFDSRDTKLDDEMKKAFVDLDATRGNFEEEELQAVRQHHKSRRRTVARPSSPPRRSSQSYIARPLSPSGRMSHLPPSPRKMSHFFGTSIDLEAEDHHETKIREKLLLKRMDDLLEKMNHVMSKFESKPSSKK